MSIYGILKFLFTIIFFFFTGLIALGVISPNKGLFWAKFIKEKTRKKSFLTNSGMALVSIILLIITLHFAPPFDYHQSGINHLDRGRYLEAVNSFKRIHEDSEYYTKKDQLIEEAITLGSVQYNKNIEKAIEDKDLESIYNYISKIKELTKQDYFLSDKMNKDITGIFIEKIKQSLVNKNLNELNSLLASSNELVGYMPDNEMLEKINDTKLNMYAIEIEKAIDSLNYEKAISLNTDMREDIGHYYREEDLIASLSSTYDREIVSAINDKNLDKALALNKNMEKYTGSSYSESTILNKIALDIDYRNFLRFEERYKNKLVIFEGFYEDLGTGQNTISLHSDDYDVWASIDISKINLNGSILEDDKIKIWGTFKRNRKRTITRTIFGISVDEDVNFVNIEAIQLQRLRANRYSL